MLGFFLAIWPPDGPVSTSAGLEGNRGEINRKRKENSDMANRKREKDRQRERKSVGEVSLNSVSIALDLVRHDQDATAFSTDRPTNRHRRRHRLSDTFFFCPFSSVRRFVYFDQNRTTVE